jgi:uncharacterized membrane protein
MGDNVFVLVAVYGNADDASTDYEAVKELHRGGVVGTYDAAVITKEASGKVHVHKHEKPTQHGAWSGLAVGALVGILFPPSILAGGVVGATAGGLIGHLWRGMSRGDMKEIGDALDEGEASLVVIGESKLEAAVKREIKRAVRTYERGIDAQARELRVEIDKAIDDAGT